MKVFHMSGRSDDMWQTPSSTTSSFSVIEVYCVTVMLRSLEINLQPSTFELDGAARVMADVVVEASLLVGETSRLLQNF